MCHIIVVTVLLIMGAFVHVASKTNDSPLEQIIEDALRIEDVNVDFSRAAKQVAKPAKPTKQAAKLVKLVDKTKDGKN